MKSIAKLKDEARKHEQNEEWEKAIQVYLQVLKIAAGAETEVDLQLYNRVGDLCVRLGRPLEAVQHYEQAADRYAEAGLYNNAIALCNKALRYDAGRLPIIRKLGQFSASQGFLTDARRYFLEYAERQFTSGNTDDAFSALEDFADVADDAEVRELLARRLQAHGRSADAVRELQRAYRMRVAAGETSQAEALQAEITAIDPAARLDDSSALPEPGAGDFYGSAELPGLVEIDPGATLDGFDADAGAAEAGTIAGFETGRADDEAQPAEYGTLEISGFEESTDLSAAAGVSGLEGLEPTVFDPAAAGAIGGLDEDLGIERDEPAFELPTLDAGEAGMFDLPTLDSDDADAFDLPTLDDDTGFDLPLLQEEDGAFDLPLLDGEGQAGGFDLPLLDDDADGMELPTLASGDDDLDLSLRSDAGMLDLPGFDDIEDGAVDLQETGTDAEGAFEMPSLAVGETAAFDEPAPETEDDSPFELPAFPAGDDRTFDLPTFEGGDEPTFDVPPFESRDDGAADAPAAEPADDFGLTLTGSDDAVDLTGKAAAEDSAQQASELEAADPGTYGLPPQESGEESSFVLPSYDSGDDDAVDNDGDERYADTAFDLPAFGSEESASDLPSVAAGDETTFYLPTLGAGEDSAFDLPALNTGADSTFGISAFDASDGVLDEVADGVADEFADEFAHGPEDEAPVFAGADDEASAPPQPELEYAAEAWSERDLEDLASVDEAAAYAEAEGVADEERGPEDVADEERGGEDVADDAWWSEREPDAGSAADSPWSVAEAEPSAADDAWQPGADDAWLSTAGAAPDDLQDAVAEAEESAPEAAGPDEWWPSGAGDSDLVGGAEPAPEAVAPDEWSPSRAGDSDLVGDAEPAPEAVAPEEWSPSGSGDGDLVGDAETIADDSPAAAAGAEPADDTAAADDEWTPEMSLPPRRESAEERAPPPRVAAESDFVDLGALLSEDDEETTRFRVQETAPTGDEDRDFAELLSQFKAKISEHLPPEDAAAHYDLGLAFKEMGLVDEAISEFQVALRAGHMRLRVYEELGHCFLQKEQYNIAEKVLRRALDMKYDDELELLGVYYHLGRAYEAMGRREQAVDAYERVLGMDINFQDVTERLAQL